MITPQTDIYLLKCPLTLSNKHQLTFANKEAQYNYFNSLAKIEVENGSYQRKDNFIRFPCHIDEIMEYNYCMYKNENYSNNWFYAFIVDMRYVNDNMTYITIKTDTFQTWQFDLNWKQSFIEREMINVNDDIPGSNLMPETFETGEYKVQGTAEFDELEHYCCIAYSGNKITLPDGTDVPVSQHGFNYNGIFSSVTFIFGTKAGFDILLQLLEENGDSDKIISSFTIPKLAILDKINEIEIEQNGEYHYYEVMAYNYMQTPIIKNLISTPSNLDGYIPLNQKLRTFPYLFLGFNPANGNSKTYRYEDFENGTPSFKLISEINQNPSVAFIPQNYRGSTGDSLSDVAYLNGYPALSYKNDVFNTWLAQNTNTLELQKEQKTVDFVRNSLHSAIGGNSSAVNSALNGDYINAGINALQNTVNNAWNIETATINYNNYIANQMAQIERQALLPDNANLSSTNATLLGYNMLDKNIFTRYSIKRQFAEKIDKFFDMFGYLTNTLKLPNLTNRPNWNYIKTIGANILGNLPQQDLAEIKALFDNGITLWHNPTTFLDYSQNNR